METPTITRTFIRWLRGHRGALVAVMLGVTATVTIGLHAQREAYLTKEVMRSLTPANRNVRRAIRQYRRARRSDIPPLGKTGYPVSQTPNWGAMRSAAEWNRTYYEMTPDDFVPVPAYDLSKLMIPMKQIVSTEDSEEITRKLFYSTKFLSTYDLDAGEYTGKHPGIDLKLPIGTPVKSIGGGRVHAAATNKNLGIHVIIEHRVENETYFSIYAHLESASVTEGQDVEAGTVIGTVGVTGNTLVPHLHLQVDRKRGEGPHVPYEPTGALAEAQKWTVHPVSFIEQHSRPTR